MYDSEFVGGYTMDVSECIACHKTRIVYIYEQNCILFGDGTTETKKGVMEIKLCSSCVPFDLLKEFIRTKEL
jgi:hypothetical protein